MISRDVVAPWPELPCHVCGQTGGHDEDCRIYGTEWDSEIGAYL